MGEKYRVYGVSNLGRLFITDGKVNMSDVFDSRRFLNEKGVILNDSDGEWRVDWSKLNSCYTQEQLAVIYLGEDGSGH
jgi:hypothetical protein